MGRPHDLTGTGFLGPEVINAATTLGDETGRPAKDIMAEWAQAGMPQERTPQNALATLEETFPDGVPGLTFPLRKLVELTSRKLFVVRENYEEYGEEFSRGVGLPQISRAFNELVDSRTPRQRKSQRTWINEGNGRGHYYDGPPVPNTALKVTLRNKLGLPPYPKSEQRSARGLELAAYAIELGSLVDFVDNLDPDKHPRSILGFTVSFVDHVRPQIVES